MNMNPPDLDREEPIQGLDEIADLLQNRLQALDLANVRLEEDVEKLKRNKFGNVAPRVDLYDGTKDGQSWLAAFNSYAQLLDWSDEHKLSLFPLYLRGESQSWYQGLDLADIKTFDDVTAKFFERYRDGDQRWLRHSQLLRYKLKPGDSLEGYTDYIRRAAKDLELPSHAALSIYLDGLPRNLRRVVCQAFPENFEAAVKLAKSAFSMEQPEDDETVMGRINALQRSINAISVSANEEDRYRYDDRPRNRRRRYDSDDEDEQHEYDSRNRRRRDVICFFCNKRGHMQKDCRRKKYFCDTCKRRGHTKEFCRKNENNGEEPMNIHDETE